MPFGTDMTEKSETFVLELCARALGGATASNSRNVTATTVTAINPLFIEKSIGKGVFRL